MRANALLPLIGILVLAGCAPPLPAGPGIAALPPAGKALARFQQEDAACRGYAQQHIGTVTVATVAGDLQRRYDVAYAQCMAASGNTVQLVPAAWAYQYAYDGGWWAPSATFGFFGDFDDHFHGHHFHHHRFPHAGFHHG